MNAASNSLFLQEMFEEALLSIEEMLVQASANTGTERTTRLNAEMYSFFLQEMFDEALLSIEEMLV
jgi:hypothetical protein